MQIVAWPMPITSATHIRLFSIAVDDRLWDQYNRQRLPISTAVSISTESPLKCGRNKPVGQFHRIFARDDARVRRALYPYTGDSRTLQFLRNFRGL